MIPTSAPTPSGRLVRTPAGRDLVLTRTFRAPIEDVWASITESERTARWFGSWTGEPGVGRTIQVRMGFEEGAHAVDMTIVACEPPRRVGLRGPEAHGGWHIEVQLGESGGTTELRFVHHLDEAPAIRFLEELGRVSRRGVVVNDLDRTELALAGAWLAGRLLTRNRFTRHDAPLSVRRAWRPHEMRALLRAAGLEPIAQRAAPLGHRYAIVAVPPAASIDPSAGS